MTKQKMTKRYEAKLLRKIRIERARADKFKTRASDAEHRVVLMRRDLDNAFCRGSAAMMAGVYAAMDDDRVATWISERLLAARVRKPPFGLSVEEESSVVAETDEVLRKAGIEPFGGDEIVQYLRAHPPEGRQG